MFANSYWKNQLPFFKNRMNRVFVVSTYVVQLQKTNRTLKRLASRHQQQQQQPWYLPHQQLLLLLPTTTNYNRVAETAVLQQISTNTTKGRLDRPTPWAPNTISILSRINTDNITHVWW